MSRRSESSIRYTLICEGWQVGGGMHGEPGIGDLLASAVEFVPLSRGRAASSWEGSARRSRDSEYHVTARVLKNGPAGTATVLDLGNINVQRRERGEVDPNLAEGEVVDMDLSLFLDPWLDAPWVMDVHRRFGVIYEWRIEGMTAVDTQSGERYPLSRATAEAMPDRGFCLLECSMIRSLSQEMRSWPTP